MVAGQDDDGVLPQLELIDGVEKGAGPLVHKGHLAAVQGHDPLPLLRCSALVDRIDIVDPLVGVIAVGVRCGRIPGLVRVERVDPQEKGRVGGTVLQPAHRRPKHARAGIVLLPLPPALVPQVLRQAQDGGRVQRPPCVLAQLGFDRAQGAPTPVVGLLTADELVGAEPARIVHRRLEHVVGVGDQPGVVAPADQDLGQRVLFGRDLVPAGGVVPVSAPVIVVAPGEGPPPGEKGAAHLQGGLSLTVGPLKGDRLAGQGIEVRRRDPAHLGVRADQVGAKGVEADHDHVHRTISCSSIHCNGVVVLTRSAPRSSISASRAIRVVLNACATAT